MLSDAGQCLHRLAAAAAAVAATCYMSQLTLSGVKATLN